MKRCGVVGFLFLVGTLSWSQSDYARVEVFGGYTYVPSNFAFLGGGENGWNAAVDMNANKWVGVAADIAQYRASYSNGAGTPSDHSTTSTFLFGPRVMLPLIKTSRITPYAHFLIGAAHINYTLGEPAGSFSNSTFQTSTSFAWEAGGGVDVRLSKHFSLRGEGDYLHNHFVTFDNQLQPRVPDSHGRLSTGVVFRF